jgi:hypothetical protein
MINLAGYDQDPREIWDISEAARYVRWWARFAGMDDLKTTEHYILDAPREDVAAFNVGFLTGCGLFGDGMKAHVLRDHKPPVQAS